MSRGLGSVQRPAIDRFADRIALTDSGCIEWVGGTNGVGYGLFFRGGRSSADDPGRAYAHRWSYEYHVGPIPEGMQIDHLCRNRACVNPEHLEPVTCAENLRRQIHANTKKTHCPKGHAYAGDNTYTSPDGRRRCRACERLRGAIRRNRRAA